MAECNVIPNNQDLFTCPICLDLLKEPVTLNCGHNYCMNCITGCWDREDQEGIYSCPQCRQTFTLRPVLRKNNVIAEVVAQFKEAMFRTDAPLGLAAGPGDVECDVCTGRKLKAVQSCLECLVSYCETHLKAHNDVIIGRKHNVVDATSQLQERMCTQHEKPLGIFCRTDQNCVCFLCMVDEHKGHDCVSAYAGRKEKQTHLKEIQRKVQLRSQEREKEQQELIKAVETFKSSAVTAVDDSERISAEMIHFIDTERSKVTELIRAQEKAEVSRAEGLLKQLEQEIAELKRRDDELEGLFHTEDHIHFLKAIQSVSNGLKDSSGITINQSFTFEPVKKSLSSLKEQLKDLYIEEFKMRPLSFGTLFGASFATKDEGGWTCRTCYVRNLVAVLHVAASSCVACQTPNPSSKGDGGTKTGLSSFSFGSGLSFGHLAKKDFPGQWICRQCGVTNERNSLKCISCQSPGSAPMGVLGSLFTRERRQWDCHACRVRNEGSASLCISCQASNPTANSSTASAFANPSSSFSFGFRAPPTASRASGYGFTADSTNMRPF